MINHRIWPANKWITSEETFTYENETEPVLQVQIGVITNDYAEEIDVINEYIYKYAYQQIKDKKAKVFGDGASLPAMVVIDDKGLVYHNASVKEYKRAIEELLEPYSIAVLISALTDFRVNQQSAQKLGDKAKTIHHIVKEGLGEKFNSFFLSQILADIVMNRKEQSDSKVSNYLKKLDNSILLSCYGGILEQSITGSCTIEPLPELKVVLMKQCESVNDIENAICREIAYRCYQGLTNVRFT